MRATPTKQNSRTSQGFFSKSTTIIPVTFIWESPLPPTKASNHHSQIFRSKAQRANPYTTAPPESCNRNDSIFFSYVFPKKHLMQTHRFLDLDSTWWGPYRSWLGILCCHLVSCTDQVGNWAKLNWFSSKQEQKQKLFAGHTMKTTKRNNKLSWN